MTKAIAALTAWLRAHPEVGKLRLCVDLGVHPSSLYAWEQGENVPKLKVALAIEDYTGGAVAPRMWFLDAEEASS